MAYRLLIVPGDNEALRGLPGQLADDVAVQMVDTANDALWEVRNAPPHAIVANLDLPGMSGLDLAEILPNFGVSTKVLLWGRGPDAKAAQQAANHGVYRFLSGPLSQEELHSALYDALGYGQSSSDAIPEAPTTTASAEAETPAPAVAAPVVAQAPEPAPAPERPRRERPAPPPPRPATETPAPVRKPITRRREGAMVLTADNLTPIRKRMDGLLQDVSAQCILLTDRAGMVLAEVGFSGALPTMILLPLLSTSFSTAGQISQMLREEEATALFMHEGSRYDIYCFDVLQRFMLVIVFDKAGTVAKIGPVWVYAKRAIRDIQGYLA